MGQLTYGLSLSRADWVGSVARARALPDHVLASKGRVLAPVTCGQCCPADGGVRSEAEYLGEDWGGDLACELEHGGLAGGVGLDAAFDELSADVLGGQVFAGNAAGE